MRTRLLGWTPVTLVCALLLVAPRHCPGAGSFPPAGTDQFDSNMTVIIEVPPGPPIPVLLQGFVSVNRSAPTVNPLGLRTIETEIISMTLVGNSGGLGPVLVQINPTLSSIGAVTAQSPTSDFPADSFFDVFVRIEVPNLGFGPGNELINLQISPMTVVSNGILSLPPLIETPYLHPPGTVPLVPAAAPLGPPVAFLHFGSNHQPVERPTFSVAPGGPSGLHPATLFGIGTPPPPLIPFPGIGLLVGDDVDALSYGVEVQDPGMPIYFSVAPGSLGVAGSAVRVSATGAPPHQPADEFTTVPGSGTNALAIDHSLFTLAPADDLDALEEKPTGFVDFNLDGLPELPVFFSLAAGSATLGLGGLPNFRPGPADIQSPDDILVFCPGPGLGIYASGTLDIGLLPGDDLDSLCLMRFAPPGACALVPGAVPVLPLVPPPPFDLAVFSLAPGSPTLLGANPVLPGGGSAASLFITNFSRGNGVVASFALLHTAAALGLLAADDLDALKCPCTSFNFNVYVPNQSMGGPFQLQVGALVASGFISPGLTATQVADQVAQVINSAPSLSNLQITASYHHLTDPDRALVTVIGAGVINSQILFNDPGVTATVRTHPPVPLIDTTPPNDDCATAIPIACGASVVGDTTLAGPETLGTCGTSDGTGGGVWYVFAGNGDQVTLTTCSPLSNYDTKIRVYEGSCATPVCVTGNDDMGAACPLNGLRSRVTFLSVPGVDYYILVHGFGADEGSFELLTSCVSPTPENCTDALDNDLDGFADCADTDCVCHVACVASPVPGVSGLTGIADCFGGNVTIAWDPASFDSYDILRDAVTIAAGLPAGTVSFTDVGVADGTYLYEVVGGCLSGNSATSSVSVNMAQYSGQQDLVVRGETPSLIDSVAALTAELTALGRSFVVVDGGIGAYPCNSAPFEIIWQMNGTFPDYRCVTAADAAALVAAHAAGTGIYTEGADQWGFCPQGTTFVDIDAVGSAADGDDSFLGMDGSDSLLGLDVSDLVNVAYSQDQVPGNDYTDQLVPGSTDPGISAAATIWVIDNALVGGPYDTGVYGLGVSGGNVISQSWEFGGFGGDKNDLASRYIAALIGGVGPPEFKRGDTNNDGLSNIADAIYLLGVLFPPGGGPPNMLACRDAGDCNDDGSIDIADAVANLGSLFGAPTIPLPAPGSSCGVDPTSDSLDCLGYGHCP